MARIKIRYFTKRPGKHGRQRHFWQPNTALRKAGWKMERLSDDLGEALQQAEARNAEVDVWRAGNGAVISDVKRGSLEALILAYKKSRHFTKLSPRSQADYNYHLDFLIRWAGDIPADLITPPMVQSLYEKLRAVKPRQAAYVIQVLRRVYYVGIPLGLVQSNPAARPGLDWKAENKGQTWSRAALLHIHATAIAMNEAAAARAVMLNYWLGQRPADLLRLGSGVIENNDLRLIQNKTGAHIWIPLAALPGEAVSGLDWSAERAIGADYTAQQFSKLFKTIRDRAAETANSEDLRAEIEALQFRTLRHTAISKMEDAECTPAQIRAISGHIAAGDHKMLATYSAVSRKRAAAAIHKRRTFEGV